MGKNYSVNFIEETHTIHLTLFPVRASLSVFPMISEFSTGLFHFFSIYFIFFNFGLCFIFKFSFVFPEVPLHRSQRYLCSSKVFKNEC